MTLPNTVSRCHRTGFKRKCYDLVSSGKCTRWLPVTGTNPNTGEAINDSKCSDDWLPIMLMENSRLQKEAISEIEALRKEVANPPPMKLQLESDQCHSQE